MSQSYFDKTQYITGSMIATEMCNFKASSVGSVGNHYRTQNVSQQPFNSDSASLYCILFLIYNQYFALGYDEGPM